MKIPYTPIKVIDTFFESPDLWRHYALQQEFYRDLESPWPGVQTKMLNVLNEDLFSSFAKKIVKHVHGASGFTHLQVTFTLIDETYGSGWIHQDEPHYNIAGLVYLNPNPPKNTGTIIHSQVKPFAEDYRRYAHEEYTALPEQRSTYEKHKSQQRSFFKPTTHIENEFNRCIMFHPSEWHSAEHFFGKDNEDARLCMLFFGIWQ
jgi:hypothetical protein